MSLTTRGADELRAALEENLRARLGRPLAFATKHDVYTGLALTVRDRMLAAGVDHLTNLARHDARRVAYLSAEYLPGPHLGNNLLCLGLTDAAREAVDALGHDFDGILAQEEEPGLGNGGLGRLASCFMDSLATLSVPAVGYGIRYEFGIFDQVIRDGWQHEVTDKWLRAGNPWELVRPEIAYRVGFGGRTVMSTDASGALRVRWTPDHEVIGVAHDTPIAGCGVASCNVMRLWTAQAVESFDFARFNHGDYDRAVEQKVASETLTKVLYPNDEVQQGRELRLKQQAFFTSCSLQDMLRIHRLQGGSPSTFHEKWAAQLNDTHPAVAVAELMRLLVDHHDLPWEEAWGVTRRTFAYTNHTLLPEALEQWRLDLFGAVLPRHLEIILEINRRFLDDVRARHPGDEARVARLSLINEAGPRHVRMAHLACVGSHTVNGVAALHSRLLRETVLRDFAELWPDRFCNVTNGVTPRRFLALSNPGLAALITSRLGDGWVRDLERLRGLEALADDAAFQAEWRAVKTANKVRLAARIEAATGADVEPDTLFDVQVKRIHEYKRQHLAVLHILTRYLRLRSDPGADVVPRTFLFGGKAAPGYFLAKRIIRLITAVAERVNNDPDVCDRLRVVFLPDFNVKQAQCVYPAADLSEQISTAGKEASGTGNMKFGLNGALTIGTLDGANVEMREAVGDENFFLFGLTTPEVAAHQARGGRPAEALERDAELHAVMAFLSSGELGRGDASLFEPLVRNLLDQDPFLVLADYRAYVDAQERVDALWRRPADWTRASILNTARLGRFSSDRAIREYCQRIWRVAPAAQ